MHTICIYVFKEYGSLINSALALAVTLVNGFLLTLAGEEAFYLEIVFNFFEAVLFGSDVVLRLLEGETCL
jgi:hypothetical protein